MAVIILNYLPPNTTQLKLKRRCQNLSFWCLFRNFSSLRSSLRFFHCVHVRIASSYLKKISTQVLTQYVHVLVQSQRLWYNEVCTYSINEIQTWTWRANSCIMHVTFVLHLFILNFMKRTPLLSATRPLSGSPCLKRLVAITMPYSTSPLVWHTKV